MILYREALERLIQIASVKRSLFLTKTETLSVEPNDVKCLMGRIASREILGQESIPPFDNSSMDGFALRAEWTALASDTNPVRIPVLGITFAGESSHSGLPKTHAACVEIMTGAPMPEGADAVVKIEDTRAVLSSDGKESIIEIISPLRPNENLRKRGSDFKAGQSLLKAGGRISAEHILGFATVGVSSVSVQRKPKVAVVSTGKELVDLISDSLSGGMIRNSTAPYLMAALPLFGAEGKFYGVIKDDPAEFKILIQEILADGPDLILTTGAVSKGKLDFVPESLLELGARIQFHGVAIRPGKPLLFAEFENGPSVFAVPGNPISTAVALRFFISPYLNALQGLPAEVHEEAKLENTTAKASGLRCFWKASLAHSLNGTRVTCLTGQESYRVSSLLPANSWVILPEDGEEISAGSVVHTVPLYPANPVEDDDLSDGGCC
jgi:molybdopterin molybdotransferase